MNITATALQSLDQAQTRFDQTARRVASPTHPTPIDDTVSLISSREQFSTSIQVLKVADKMEHQAIDLLA